MSNKIEEQAELRLKVEQVLHLAVADLGMSVLFRDSDPVKTGVGDKNAPYYWTDKLIDLVSAKQKEKWEKEHEQSKLHAELLGVSHSNDAFHDLSAPTLQMWFSNEMKDLEERIAHLSSKEQKGTQ